MSVESEVEKLKPLRREIRRLQENVGFFIEALRKPAKVAALLNPTQLQQFAEIENASYCSEYRSTDWPAFKHSIVIT